MFPRTYKYSSSNSTLIKIHLKTKSRKSRQVIPIYSTKNIRESSTLYPSVSFTVDNTSSP